MYELVWVAQAAETYKELKARAVRAKRDQEAAQKKKTSPAEGLFRQVVKCLHLLASNPRHPGLQTHAYSALPNPYQKREKVFEAYVQQHTPGAYRLFWCYGPKKDQITIIAMTPHP